MKVKQEFFGFNPIMWMGVVEDNEDPIKLGRLKVRIFGWHNGSPTEVDKEPGVKTEDLPWAQIMMPVATGPNSGTGGPVTGIQQGTWVMGIFLDGEIAREPLVLGSIPGIPMQGNPNPTDGDPVEGFYDPDGIYPKSTKDWGLEEPDTNRLARNDNVQVHGDKEDFVHTVIQKKSNRAHKSVFANGFDLEEPVAKTWADFKAKYPDNKVLETKSGHIFEIDDTPTFERIHVYHKNGSYIEMGGACGPGNRIDKVTGDWYTMIDRNWYKAVAGDINTAGRHISFNGKTFVVKSQSMTVMAPNVVVSGKVLAGTLASQTGATDTFVDVNGKVVTVTDGIVTSVTEGG